MALQGKRIFITGGAGFIATTLARGLVDENEVIALDNLMRQPLQGPSNFLDREKLSFFHDAHLRGPS